MDGQFMLVLAVAALAAVASPLGGVVAIWLKPSTLLLSICVGFAGGVLLGTFAFEMMPKAQEMSSSAWTVVGFLVGFAAVYALDLYVNRGAIAGPDASQNSKVERFHRRRKPHGGHVAVIGSATSSEELIEGLTIGVSAAIDPSVALITGLAIGIDNVSEALSIGELAREEDGERYRWKTLKWTGLIGVSLFTSAMAGWFFLRGLPDGVLGFLLAIGAGAMFYLTVGDLIPEAESHQYQQSAAIAVAAGFLLIFVLAQFG